MRVCVECGGSADSAWRCAQCGHQPESTDGVVRFAPGFDGTGDGFRAEYFADLVEREHGGDVFSLPLAHVRSRVPDGFAYQLDALRIPFRDEFDVVGAFDVIEHIDDDSGVLREMAAAARPGGGVVITVPQHAFLWSEADEYGRHKRRYSRGELTEKIEAAGLDLLFVSSFVTILLPLMAVSRLRPRRESENFSEFELSPWLDSLLESALALERPLIARGLSLPFGGSLLAVARVPVA